MVPWVVPKLNLIVWKQTIVYQVHKHETELFTPNIHNIESQDIGIHWSLLIPERLEHMCCRNYRCPDY